MADHEQMKDQLVSLVLGELSEPQRSQVAAHVAECDECRAELKQLEQLLQRRQEAFNDFRKNIESKYMTMREATSDSIRGLLTSEQQSEFEALVKEFDSSYRHQERR